MQDESASFYVQALYAYSGIDTSSLSFQQGDIIEVLSTLPSGWWDGVICDRKVRGWFPSNYVHKLSDEQALGARQEMMGWWEEGTSTSSRLASDLILDDSTKGKGSEAADAMEGARDNNELYRRKGSVDSTDRAMEALMREAGGEDFSSGGDVFGELAAAAATSSASAQAQRRDANNVKSGTSILASNLHQQQSTLYSTEQHQSTADDNEDDAWVPRVTYAGQVFYYNIYTHETSQEMPMDGRGDGVVISKSEFDQEEPREDEAEQPDESPSAIIRRISSSNSDESFLDSGMNGAGAAGDRITIDRSTSRAGFNASHRRPSAADLLSPVSLPLLAHLEVAVMDALRNLMKGAGQSEGQTKIDPAVERQQLGSLGDETVAAIRTLIHCSGVYESVPSASVSSSITNQIIGDYPATHSLPSAAQQELRTLARRVTSTLSKLVLSVRAVWGLLETVPQDQYVESEIEQSELMDAASSSAEARLRHAREKDWSVVKERRIRTELKLRSEILAGAKDVQSHTLAFLTELERIIVEAHRLASPHQPVIRALLRAPRAMHGMLRTNAAAFLLPGDGSGGNWRGNGFVTLPAPASTLDLDLNYLAYSYPSIRLSSEVTNSLSSASLPILDSIEQLKAIISSFYTPNENKGDMLHSKSASTLSHSSSRSSLSPFSATIAGCMMMLSKVSSFLAKVEEIDVASCIDVDVDLVVRHDMPHGSPIVGTSRTRRNAGDTKSLLVALETSKQAVYDASASLTMAVQDMHFRGDSSPALLSLDSTLTFLTSPLSVALPVLQIDVGQGSVLSIGEDLRQAITTLCTTFEELSVIADSQSLQQDRRLDSNDPSLRLSVDNSTVAGPSHATSGTMSASSSHSSLRGPFDDDERNEADARSTSSHASVDSDFFFPSQTSVPNLYTSSIVPSATSPPTTPSSLASKSRGMKTSQLSSQMAGWERRESSATMASSLHSDGLPYRRGFGGATDTVESIDLPTRSTSNSKLAKLLGSDAPSSASSTMAASEPTPPWLGSDYGADEISFNMEGQVKGGTIQALVIAAASHEGRVDSNYLSTFLTTYRTFCTSHELLDLLMQRFMIEAPMGLVLDQMKVWETRKLRPIRARVANVIKSWVRDYMEHDNIDHDLLRRISDFASLSMRDPVQSPQIIKAVEERLSGSLKPVGNIAPGLLPPSIIPRTFRKLKFLDIDALELARQLTITDGRLFARITPQECLGKTWPKKFGNEAPNISAMIDMSNAVTRWVTETILLQDDAKKRAATIKHFVAVGERCLALNNFSSVIQIIAGLNSTPIHRLRRTWETVGQKTMIILGTLNNVMRSDKNYKQYREALRSVTPPCVPFLGMYLTDWTFIGDGIPDMLREKPHQVNFQKRQKAAELILSIKLYQSTTYNLSSVPVLNKFLDEQLFPKGIDVATDEQRLYEISLLREPREREDEKIARLLSESGFL